MNTDNTPQEKIDWWMVGTCIVFLVGVIIGIFLLGYNGGYSDGATIASSTLEIGNADAKGIVTSTLFLNPSQEDQNQDNEIQSLTDRLNALDGGTIHYWTCPNITTPIETVGNDVTPKQLGYFDCTLDKAYQDTTIIGSPIFINP